MWYYPLLVVRDTLFFTAECVLWTAVKGVELVYTVLYYLFTVIAGAVPVFGNVLVGLSYLVFYLVAEVLKVLLNVLAIAFSFIQTAVQYILFLITCLFQLCVQLFYAVVNLDWPVILETIGGACALVINTILNSLSVILNAVAYLASGLGTFLFQVGTFVLLLIQNAMLYVTLMITAMSQLCVYLFHAVIDLNWPMILETIHGGCAHVTNTVLDGFSIILNATLYLISGLVALLFQLASFFSSVLFQLASFFSSVLFQLASFFSSVLVYVSKSFLMLIRNAVRSVQLLFGNKFPYMKNETVATLLLVGFAIFCIYVLYSLTIFCIRSYLRHQAKLRRQGLNVAGQRRPIEVNAAGQRRPVEVNAAAQIRPVDVNAAGQRRHVLDNDQYRAQLRARVPTDRIRRRNYEQANDTRLQAYEYSSGLLKNNQWKLGKTGDVNLSTQQNPAPKGEDKSVNIMHLRLQELETELMKEKEAKQCVVCMDKPRQLMIRPCNHYCVCEECSGKLRGKCPVCTKYFVRAEKVYNV